MDFSQRTDSNIKLLEVSIVLGDLLARFADVTPSLQAGLDYVIDLGGQKSGLLALQNQPGTQANVLIKHTPPEAWETWISQVNFGDLNISRDGKLVKDPIRVDGLENCLIYPVFSADQLEGILLVSEQSENLQASEIIKISAPVFGRAIQRLREKPEDNNHKNALSALTVMASTLESQQGSEESQQLMMKRICEIVAAEAAMLVLLEEEQDELVNVVIYDAFTEQIRHESRVIQTGVVLSSIQETRPFLDNNVQQNHLFNNRFDAPGGMPIRSLLCSPLIASNQALGAIIVYNHHGGDFSKYDNDLMDSITVALANSAFSSKLIQQLKLTNADLEASRWELLRSRNTLRALFDNIPSSIYIVDRRFTLIAVNMSRADRVNSKPNLMVGRKCHQVLNGKSEPCPGCRVSETLYGGQTTNRVNRDWINNDQFMEWDINTYPIYDVNSQPTQAIVVEQDITEKKRLEVSLAQSEKLAAVGQLAAGVAHEINNPLAAIIANAQILERDLPKDNDLLESVKLIQMAGSRASQVVRNLLGFARKENYEFTQVDLNETIRSALMLLQHEFISRPVDLVFDLADDLPLINASKDHLQGVWVNLMLNAFDALENRPGEVRISTRKQGNEFRVTISDTGKGIPPEKVSRIFEPFYTTKEAGRGTGLGLSLCHRIIKQHSGYILVESQVGVGTKFIVVLPYRPDETLK